MNRLLLLRILLPVGILALGAAAIFGVLRLRRPPAILPAKFLAPLVQVMDAAPATQRIDVEATGTVEPFRVVELASQVGGRVVTVAPGLRAGGFFAKDEVLVAIDPVDYELAVVQRQSEVTRAELRVAQERAEAAAAVAAWQQLEGDRPADPLVVRAPQLRDAEAALAAAEALLDRARLDLARTRLAAPFAGRVQKASVEVGQLVQPGQPLATLFDIECAEVRLPLANADTAFVELPLHGSYGATEPDGVAVECTAEFGGRTFRWQGRLVRTEGELDRRTRQLVAVARIDAPYDRSTDPARPPLAFGTFVQAKIAGRTLPDVMSLPRSALRGDAEIWVVDSNLRLRRRTVEVLRRRADDVLVRGGCIPGERICITALETATEGMPVRLAPPTAAASAGPQPANGEGR